MLTCSWQLVTLCRARELSVALQCCCVVWEQAAVRSQGRCLCRSGRVNTVRCIHTAHTASTCPRPPRSGQCSSSQVAISLGRPNAPTNEQTFSATPLSVAAWFLLLPANRPAVVSARESLAWEAGPNRVRLRDCKGTEVGKVLQDRKKLKSVR